MAPFQVALSIAPDNRQPTTITSTPHLTTTRSKRDAPPEESRTK